MSREEKKRSYSFKDKTSREVSKTGARDDDYGN